MSMKVFLRAIIYSSWKLHQLQCWLQNVVSTHAASSTWTSMEEPLPLQDFSSATGQGNAAMSRRRVSVKDLGQVDCQGWLYKKRESRGFLGNKWKKYWLVLKGSSLYWYTSTSAEKAEGYITLRGFTVDQASECKRKWAIKAFHPQIITLFFAAENTKDMHKWLSKLTAASASNKHDVTVTVTGECYSEASDDEEEEEDTAEAGAQYTEQLTTGSVNGCLPPPRSSSSPCRVMLPLVSPVSNRTECQSSDTESWVELSTESQLTEESSEHNDPGRLQDIQEDERPASDELEMLYLHLKNASLTPCGALQPSSKRDYRSSFIRRCKDDNINEKLHLVRTLNSTLKAKEADLMAIEQVLCDTSLDAGKYREWRSANVLLLEEISQKPRLKENVHPAESEMPQGSTPTVYSETSV